VRGLLKARHAEPGKRAQLAGVITAHPGTQYSYQTALAMQEAGFLRRHLTGIYYKPQSAAGRALSLLPPLARRLRQRRNAALDDSLVHQCPFAEALYLSAARLKPLRKHAAGIVRWRNRRFGHIAARVIQRERPAALICYDTSALQAFERAKTLGRSAC
jgi:hypothetical protein